MILCCTYGLVLCSVIIRDAADENKDRNSQSDIMQRMRDLEALSLKRNISIKSKPQGSENCAEQEAEYRSQRKWRTLKTQSSKSARWAHVNSQKLKQHVQDLNGCILNGVLGLKGLANGTLVFFKGDSLGKQSTLQGRLNAQCFMVNNKPTQWHKRGSCLMMFILQDFNVFKITYTHICDNICVCFITSYHIYIHISIHVCLYLCYPTDISCIFYGFQFSVFMGSLTIQMNGSLHLYLFYVPFLLFLASFTSVYFLL